MKKLLLICVILLIFITITNAQRRLITLMDSVAINDTLVKMRTSNNYMYGVEIDASALTGTLDAVLEIGVSNTDAEAAYKRAYPNFYRTLSANGKYNFAVEHTLYEYIWIKIVTNSCTGGKIHTKILLTPIK